MSFIIKPTLYRQNLEKFKCSFCLNILNLPMITTCAHLFCKSCIITHLATKDFCLSCNSQIDLESIRFAPDEVFQMTKELRRIHNDPSNPHNTCPSFMKILETMTIEDDTQEKDYTQDQKQSEDENMSQHEGEKSREGGKLEGAVSDEESEEFMIIRPSTIFKKSKYHALVELCQAYRKNPLNFDFVRKSETSRDDSTTIEKQSANVLNVGLNSAQPSNKEHMQIGEPVQDFTFPIQSLNKPDEITYSQTRSAQQCLTVRMRTHHRPDYVIREYTFEEPVGPRFKKIRK